VREVMQSLTDESELEIASQAPGDEHDRIKGPAQLRTTHYKPEDASSNLVL